MQTILKSSIFENGMVVKNYNQDFTENEISDQKNAIDLQDIKGEIRDITLDGLILTARDLYISKPYQVNVYHDFPLFKLQFEFEGQSTYLPSNQNQTSLTIDGGCFNLFYIPEVNGTLSFVPGRRKTLEIQFTEKYIDQLIGGNYGHELYGLGAAIRTKKPYIYSTNKRSITNDLMKITTEILSCDFNSTLKQAFIDVKVKELLVSLLANPSQNFPQDQGTSLSPGVLKKVQQIEDHIKQKLNEPMTITELALLVGLSSTKLKSSFKTKNGTSIFKHITFQRMTRAKDLMQNHGCNVTEASDAVGYKNPQHFTVAFKRTFGYLPSALLKK